MKINTNFINNTGIENLANPLTPVRKIDNLLDYLHSLFSVLTQYSKDIKKDTTVSISGENVDIIVTMSKC